MNKFSFVSLFFVMTFAMSTMGHAMSDNENILEEVSSHHSPVIEEALSQLTVYSPHGLRIQEFEIPELIMDEAFKNISVNDLVQNVRLVSQNFKALVHEHLLKRKQTKLDDLIKFPPPPPPLDIDGLLAFGVQWLDVVPVIHYSSVFADFYPFDEKFDVPPRVAELPDSEKRIVQSAKIHYTLIQAKKKSDYEKRQEWFANLKFEILTCEFPIIYISESPKFELPKFELTFIKWIGEEEFQQLQKWQINLIKAQSSRGKKHNKQRKIRHAFNIVTELEARIRTLYKPRKHQSVEEGKNNDEESSSPI